VTDQELTDQIAIRELNATYVDAVMRRSASAMSSVWARDGRWYFLGKWIVGRDQILARWQKAMSGFPVVFHQMTSEQISVSGDGAQSRVYLVEEVITKDHQVVKFLGVYNDVCTRLDEGWRYSSRRFDLIYQGPGSLKAEGWLGYPKPDS
jgi:ketosteroid isomerase-like protein